MRFQFSFLVLGVIALSSGCAPQAAPVASGRKITPKGATSFTSKSHGFSIWLPLKPKQSQKTAQMKNVGMITVRFFEVETEPVNYVVIATPVSPEVDESVPAAQLDVMQRALLKPSGVKLQKREDIQLNGFQGRELKVSLKAGTEAKRAHFYFTPKFFYMILANGYKEQMQKQSAQINKVFDSFRILPQ